MMNPPTDTHTHTPTHTNIPSSATLQRTFHITKKEGNFTFLLYYHKILVGAQHLHSYLRNMIVGVIMLHLDLLICCCMGEKGGEGRGADNICFRILLPSPTY